MPDLGILEIVIAFFLFMPWTQAAVKEFRPAGGFARFPPIALFCVVALFPAYGFRPECLPLLILTIVDNILNVKTLKAKTARPGRRNNPLHLLAALTFIALATIAAVAFLPTADPRSWTEAQQTTLHDKQRNATYYVRTYRDPQAPDDQPLIIVVPPIIGSAAIVDQFCQTLSRRGASVASIARPGLDIPASRANAKKIIPPIADLKDYALGLLPDWPGKTRYSAHFEQERAHDIQYILRAYSAENAAGRPVYLLAYAEAARAAAQLAASKTFLEENPTLRGIVAVRPQPQSAAVSIPVLPIDACAYECTDIPEKYPILTAVARALQSSRPTNPAAAIHTFILEQP
ncbi:MAG: hypothetical protein LBS82_05520 [Spirochaetaceae bacterium]|jgi:hypothetical protein|nr:hypothetical protein [Spirochaetaceae bacterium]